MYGHIEGAFIAGDLSRAKEESELAYEKFKTSRPDWAARFRVELAKVLIYQGKSEDALPLLQTALPAASDIELNLRRKMLLSIAQARQGQLDQAESTTTEAEREAPNSSLRAAVLGVRGSIHVERGDLDAAERDFLTDLTTVRFSKNKFLQSEVLLNLGHIALLEEHYEDALQNFSESSALARSIGAKLLLEKATGNIGWAYYKLGDFQRSLDNFTDAQKEASELGALSDQVHWLNNAGMSEFRLGDLKAARSFYERTLTLARSIPNEDEILDANVNLGFLLLRSGDLNAAEAHAREAMRVAASRPNNTDRLEPQLLSALLRDKQGNWLGAQKMLLELEENTKNLPSLRWENESALARIYAKQAGGEKESELWFRRSIETFRRQRSSLANVESTLPFLENGDDLYMGYTQHLIDEHKTDAALAVLDESRAESLADGLKLTPVKQEAQAVNARAIAARLQATVLVYSMRPKASYLWAVSPGREEFYKLAGSETIAPLIEAHTKAILASKDVLAQANGPDAPDVPGRRLYDELVRPAEGLIRKGGRGGRVFIVGDEELSSLNFETLLAGNEAPHYWIEDVTITNAKSLRLLAMGGDTERRAAAARATRRLLLIGDPVYRREEYAELANAATEVDKIAGHFDAGHRMVLTGAQATPEAYGRTGPGQFSYIHFVAHATANMTSPLDSAVVLSRGQDEASGYKLYARDILKQGLHADLVTLSACYGSGLRNYSGEGLVGLAWAFLRAGSHHVIGAMWEVSDASTPELMDRMYDGLAKGDQPDAALRDAKLTMIHAGGVFRKPLYWAPFQLYSGA